MIKDLIFLNENCQIFFYYGIPIDENSAIELEDELYFVSQILLYFDKKFKGIYPSFHSFNALSSITKQVFRFKNDKQNKMYKKANKKNLLA